MKMRENLVQYENEDEVMYGKIFEKHMISRIGRGVSYVARHLGEESSSQGSFSLSRTVFFTYAVCTPVQVWFQDIRRNFLLGSTVISCDTLYCPTGRSCYTVDAILVQRLSDKIVVNFIQATVSDNHGVSAGGFFAMFMLVKLINAANKLEVSVKFIFVVPENVYNVFQSPEAEYLRSLFKDIEILVMMINEGEQNNEQLLKSQSTITKTKVNKITKKVKTKAISKSVTQKKPSRPHSFLGKFVFNDETQEQNENSQQSAFQDQAILLVKNSVFKNINLVLMWNYGIQCVFEQSEVFVVDELKGKNEQDSENDSFEEDLLKSDSNNDLEIDSNEKNRGVSDSSDGKKKKKKKEKKTTKESTSPSLVSFKNYGKTMDSLNQKLDIIDYSEICTLFYKRSRNKNPEDDADKKEKKILNLLTEFPNEINIPVDGDKIFEIGFSREYSIREILVLLGCFNLHLRNIKLQSNEFWKVTLKFNPFKSQVPFLKRIQQNIFNRTTINISMDLKSTLEEENKELDDAEK
jgi:hypothetical protein